MATINTETDSCHRCGGSLRFGHELRQYAPDDEVILCGYCVADEKAEAEDYSDWMADMQMDLREGF